MASARRSAARAARTWDRAASSLRAAMRRIRATRSPRSDPSVRGWAATAGADANSANAATRPQATRRRVARVSVALVRTEGRMKVGVLTGGGDCPGLNAVIRAVVRKGETVHGDQVIGFRDG